MNNLWQTEHLGDLITIETGKREKGGGSLPGGVLSIGGEHINISGRVEFDVNQKYVSEKFYESLKQGKVQKNDVLLVKDGATTGKTAIIYELPSDRLAVNEHVFLLRSIRPDKLDNIFLYFLLNSEIGQSHIQKRYHGLIGGINRSDVKELEIPTPPLKEQRGITHVLATVQNAIEHQWRRIILTRELKSTLMSKLFSKGVLNEKQRNTEIGLVPESWNVGRFIDFCVLQRGFDITKKEQTTGNVPVVSSGGISSYHNVAKVKAPGVVIGRKGSLGTVHFIDVDYWPHDTTLWVKDFKGNDPLFTAYFLETLKLEKYDSGVSNPTLNRNTVHAEIVSYPQLSEQIEIGNILHQCDIKISVTEKKKKILEELFHTLLHQLMTRKVRVKDIELPEPT